MKSKVEIRHGDCLCWRWIKRYGCFYEFVNDKDVMLVGVEALAKV